MTGKIDKNLFIYLTKRAGHSLQDVADLWQVPLSGVYKRLSGDVEIRRDEMESWMKLVNEKDAGPIFFPALVADSHDAKTPGVGGQNGG